VDGATVTVLRLQGIHGTCFCNWRVALGNVYLLEFLALVLSIPQLLK